MNDMYLAELYQSMFFIFMAGWFFCIFIRWKEASRSGVLLGWWAVLLLGMSHAAHLFVLHMEKNQ